MAVEKTIFLPPIHESKDNFAELERRIIKAYRDLIYGPILAELLKPADKFSNSKISVIEAALKKGFLTYSKGRFRGGFNSALSKALKGIGAEWDPKREEFRLPKSQVPEELKPAIAEANLKFEERIKEIDKILSQILPADFAGSIKSEYIFDKNILETDSKIVKTLKSVSVPIQLTPSQRAKIAREWTDNLDRSIQNFTKKEIRSLRATIQRNVASGGRYESVAEAIKSSFGVTERKAHFLARQETNLLMAKLKETRYVANGVYEYKWGCAAGSAAHPVRPSHKILEGRVFRFDQPPITTPPGESPRRNNPGEDYNCRCFAIPIVRKIKA